MNYGGFDYTLRAHFVLAILLVFEAPAAGVDRPDH
jgi:hypothetical protein